MKSIEIIVSSSVCSSKITVTTANPKCDLEKENTTISANFY